MPVSRPRGWSLLGELAAARETAVIACVLCNAPDVPLDAVVVCAVCGRIVCDLCATIVCTNPEHEHVGENVCDSPLCNDHPVTGQCDMPEYDDRGDEMLADLRAGR